MKKIYTCVLSFLFILFLFGNTNAQTISDVPPSGTLRTAAEWEEIQALVVTWTDYKSVLAEIIRYAQEECKVIVHCRPNRLPLTLNFLGETTPLELMDAINDQREGITRGFIIFSVTIS